MDKSEIIAFLNANPACHLATVEGDQPRVRGLLIYRADEKGILFHTGKMKDLHKQLVANPKVEMCFNDLQKGIQVRVAGTAELVEDLNLKKEIVSKREFLKNWIDSKLVTYDTLAVYRVRDCVATVWTMATNFAPTTYVRI
ncbi:MAG: pyridoxamine 5'-phosphate oxidase family protein [Dehalococcoidia bacterium]|nr:pyridoxamine 5'-phosphate oxidase family protein [Dehalococcoidia bacterium]